MDRDQKVFQEENPQRMRFLVVVIPSKIVLQCFRMHQVMIVPHDVANPLAGHSRSQPSMRQLQNVCYSMHLFYQIVNYSIIEAAAALGALDLPDDMPPAERKLKELEYQLALKDLINSGLQEELTRIQNSLNKAVGQVSAWQYDRRGMDFQPIFSYTMCISCNSCKLGSAVRMVVDSILLHAKSGPNDHRKDAPPFTA